MGYRLDVYRFCKMGGFECDFVARGETVEGVLKIAGEHSKEIHNVDPATYSKEQMKQIRAAIKEE